MWLNYDSGCNVLRIGLVSGSTATVPNVFPVFDLNSKTWSFDTLGQALSCQIDIGAASRECPRFADSRRDRRRHGLQVNTGVIDVATAITSLVRMEIDGQGLIIDLREFILRVKAQTAGSLTLTPSPEQHRPDGQDPGHDARRSRTKRSDDTDLT